MRYVLLFCSFAMFLFAVDGLFVAVTHEPALLLALLEPPLYGWGKLHGAFMALAALPMALMCLFGALAEEGV